MCRTVKNLSLSFQRGLGGRESRCDTKPTFCPGSHFLFQLNVSSSSLVVASFVEESPAFAGRLGAQGGRLPSLTLGPRNGVPQAAPKAA